MLHKTNFTFQEKLKNRESGSTKYIVLHHSEVTSKHTASDVHQWHMSKGWAGIGYHYFIAKDGEIYEGRPHNTIGAHAYGVNSKSVGICFEGDFNKEELTDNQEKAAITLITLLSFAYPDAKLCRHCDFTAKKNCPGNSFPFESIREKVIKAIKEMGFSNNI